MKYILSFSVMGVIAGLIQPPLAEALNMEPMTGWQQYGICGGCLSIIALMVLRTIPSMSKLHADAIKEAAAINAKGIETLADTLREGQESQVSFLRDAFNMGKKRNEQI